MENTEQKNQKSPSALREERVLEFWKENNIFEKSVSKNEDKKEFVFYEGPPTANAKPALHHLEARAFKDVIPRYKTMQGFHVRRRAGWDTHGLPVELQIEKKLGLQSKKEIEQYGVAKFNKECKDSVFEYIGEWEKFTDRIGYWVDKKNAYYTFDAKYVESLWSIVKHVDDRDLLYKDYKVVPWCPRCGTGLSSHELGQDGAYQEVKDISVYVKFKIVGQKNTYLLAWTTTPWTLPGNVALSVGKDIDYAKFEMKSEPGVYYVTSHDYYKKIEDGGNVTVTDTEDSLTGIENHQKTTLVAGLKGSELLGLEYEPIYPDLKQYLEDTKTFPDQLNKGWKVYSADFVNTTDGTGIVHIAPMHGNDDFDLANKENLPKYHIIDPAGVFNKTVGLLEGVSMATTEERKQVNISVLKYLQEHNLYFDKKNYPHEYPHCWRCKTPLIYYARDSWYIGMSKLRKDLIKENEKINWEPSHIKEGRFGEWIREAKDWAISRERYWGTPLPIWVADDGEKIIVDSYDTLKKYTKKSGNTYFVMRHGQTDANVKGLVCPDHTDSYSLNDFGNQQVGDAVKQIKNEGVDLIISSDFLRAKETAELARTAFGLGEDAVLYDPRLREMNIASFAGKTWDVYHGTFAKTVENFSAKIDGDESYQDVKNRITGLLYEIEEKYKNKKILFVTHGGPAWLLCAGVEGRSVGESLDMILNVEGFHYFKNAQVKKLDFVPLPHNEIYELDPHRPFIDDVVLEKDGKAFRRVKEVMDVWFDSGAMPFAQDHYPFEKENGFNPKHGLFSSSHGYPADFISEAIDQTRGWFYTLLAVGVLMEVGTPYKNVICLGHLLDKEGKKMSKSIGNIVNPWEQMDKFGVDTLRLWMYSVNQPGDSKNYDEKTVAEIHNKIFNLFYNVLSFYELYRDTSLETNSQKLETTNVLDQWIFARLNELVLETTNSMDTYKVLEPVRALRDFIDDLSTWYLRRSRDRIKDGDREAKKTLYIVMKTVAQIMAPFAPFASEDIWQKLKNDTDQESVHLSEWPKTIGKEHSHILENMRMIREICTAGNMQRKKLNIPVKQPLSKLFVKEYSLDLKYGDLVKDELNVKEVVESKTITELVELNTEITSELKQEGDYRELVRMIQGIRKEKGLTPSDVIELTLPESYKEIVNQFEESLKKTVLAKLITFSDIEAIEVKK
jgi:isoleucyl-tRNA synthetase